jgi:hypothetical protein
LVSYTVVQILSRSEKKSELFFEDTYIDFEFRELVIFNKESEFGEKKEKHSFKGLNRPFIEVAHFENTINKDSEIFLNTPK